MPRKPNSLLHPVMAPRAEPAKKDQIATLPAQIDTGSPTAKDRNSDSFSTSLVQSFPTPNTSEEDGTVLFSSNVYFGDSILHYLPSSVILEIFQYVSQFDLINLALVCRRFYSLAIERLYKRVTIVLNSEYPLKFKGNRHYFVRENGMKYMDSALILSYENLTRFMETLERDTRLVNYVKYFVFDKCHPGGMCSDSSLETLQTHILDFFGKHSSSLNFLHVTFQHYAVGDLLFTKFLSNVSIRLNLFKLYVERLREIRQPILPPGLTYLFLRLDDFDLKKTSSIDLATEDYGVIGSLVSLACATNLQLGLHILDRIKLLSPNTKLKLRNLTVIHRHKEDVLEIDSAELYRDLVRGQAEILGEIMENKAYIDEVSKRLNFQSIESKIDISSLNLLYLKVDCCEHMMHDCNCFPQFLKGFTEYSITHDGLPNLKTFELELFPNLEWLRPHQILETILTPLGSFLRSLGGLTRLTIDFSTPGFKMFDNSMAMSSSVLNKLNERLMEAFFLCFFSSEQNRTILNLKTLQLPDFLTSFIYYKPDFYESLLHTCRCRGCALVLHRLEEMFYPLSDEELDDDQDNSSNLQSTLYILIGFILGKLQADREVCVPIKQRRMNFGFYPVHKGQPHTLHHQFHRSTDCDCQVKEDPQGLDEMNIDNLVTTYIVHQLRPVVEYLALIFFKLDNLVVHGVYYEFDQQKRRPVPIFDRETYPATLLASDYIVDEDIEFGRFDKKLSTVYR